MFFTLVTENRAPLFADEANRTLLREAFGATRLDRPFSIEAMVLLPDHLHLLMTLPEGDDDYASRLRQVKSHFTRGYLAAGGNEQPRSASRVAKRRRGVWQRWFWEHRIRDERDHWQHVQYILFNPVKHGYVACPHAWAWSSFAQFVREEELKSDWYCVCDVQDCERMIDPAWAGQCEP